MTMLTEFNLMLPANIDMFLGFMQDISNLNLIKTDSVFDFLGFP